MAGTWTTFDTGKIGDVNLYADTMLLLTDGSVLVHQRYLAATDFEPGIDGRIWMRLTPNSNGSYDASGGANSIFQ